jgi:hypothetical protein
MGLHNGVSSRSVDCAAISSDFSAPGFRDYNWRRNFRGSVAGPTAGMPASRVPFRDARFPHQGPSTARPAFGMGWLLFFRIKSTRCHRAQRDCGFCVLVLERLMNATKCTPHSRFERFVVALCVVAATVGAASCDAPSAEDSPDSDTLSDSGPVADADAGAVELPADTPDSGSDVASDASLPSGPWTCESKGDPGCDCAGNSDCNSGWCVTTADGSRCTRGCDTSCPDGWACKPIGSGGSDVAFICVPLDTNLCRPCGAQSDCAQLGDTGGFCLPGEPGAGSFCGIDCAEDGGCPDGFGCNQVEYAAGKTISQCTPTSGECACNPKATKDGAATACSQANEHGTCIGERICGAAGLTACDAKTPAPETCNGIDDDCDGETDEDLDPVCERANGLGACAGEQLCVDGQWAQCDAPIPSEEVCDGVDNNCDPDGLVDEGYPDTDGDGQKDCVDDDVDGDGIADDGDGSGEVGDTLCTKANTIGCDDNCPKKSNADQADKDQDGIGDECDPDIDGDGVDNTDDCEPNSAAITCTTFYWDQDGDGAALCDVQVCACKPENFYTVTSCDAATADCNDKSGAIAPSKKETCNGLDDDCNGATDEDSACDGDLDGVDDALDNCPTISNSGQANCDGDAVGDACDDDDDNDGTPDSLDCGVCDPDLPAGGETCNGADDDCDGKTDEDWGDLGAACDGDDADGCATGVLKCAAGGDGLTCDEAAGSAAVELCDGQDNDCDGKTDEDWPNLGTACDGPDDDACSGGVVACNPSGAGAACNEAAQGGKSEVCDGVDNDCDGATDENWPNLGQACDGLDKDLCANGDTVCGKDGASMVCDEAPGLGLAELCDNVDNDCDGQTDEGWPGLGQACDGGDSDSCAGGKIACSPSGQAVLCDESLSGGAVEVCDGLDNDCDGETDEDAKKNGLGAPCDSLVDLDVCNEGVWTCAPAGSNLDFLCSDPGEPSVETCNGKDDDCDGLTDETWPDLGSACDGPDADLCLNGLVQCKPDGKATECGPELGDGSCKCGPTTCNIGGACVANGAPHPTKGCLVCNVVANPNGWSPRAAATICRSAATECDQAESCDGVSEACPADELAPNGSACGSSDQCLGGVCVDCFDAAGCGDFTTSPSGCQKLVCGAGNTCQLGTAPTGTACDDGVFCNGADTCNSQGQCENAGDPCAGSTNGCADKCNEALKSCFDAKGSGCDDGVFCNGADTCDGQGGCIAAGNPCAGGAVCANTCQESTKSCFATAGASCGDGKFCNGADTCDGAGKCEHAGNPCAAGDACNKQCNESEGTCFAPQGASCNNGLFCDGTDTCNGSGKCNHTGDPCAGGAVCKDKCDEVSGSCNAPVGSACDDDIHCNGVDTCNAAGACIHTGDPCVGGPPCQNQCNEVAESCLAVAGTACDDQNYCNGVDTCSGAGVCDHTGDPCVGGAPCQSTCNAVAKNCKAPAGQACDDALYCNGLDFCDSAGACKHQGDPCIGGAPCQNICNESSDQCKAANGTTCEDGNPCTVADTCTDGACTPGSGPSCDDSQVCTTDSCGPTGTCQHALVGGYCMISSACVVEGTPEPGNPCRTCQPSKSATGWTASNTASCGPLDHATAACVAGQCAVAQCEVGWSNANGNASDGCESESGTLIYVDAAASPVGADGTQEHPFPAIPEGLDAVKPGGTVLVSSGYYPGDFVVDVDGINLVGAGSDTTSVATVVVASASAAANVTIAASGVRFEGFVVSGGREALSVAGTAGSPLSGVTLANLLVGDASSGAYHGNANGIGIYHASGLVVESIRVAHVVGGDYLLSGNSIYNYAGRGMNIVACVGCEFTDVAIQDINGGKAYSTPKAGYSGGAAVGLNVSDCDGITIRNVDIRQVSGARGGDSSDIYPWSAGVGGQAVGGLITGATGVLIEHAVVADVTGGPRGFGYYQPANGSASGLRIVTSALSPLNHLTLARVRTANGGVSRGIEVTAEQAFPVVLSNSIIFDVSGTCIYSDSSNGAFVLAAQYTNVSSCGVTQTNAFLEPSCSQLSPAFIEAANGNFHLSPTSPCIDAGKPTSECVSEPFPNGCRVNMGAYGNTEEATPKTGAVHCEVCP